MISLDQCEKGLVSVVIPVFNGEAFLARALTSVFAQSYRPLEVIVVDDGSTDSTAQIAQSFPEVQYFRQPNGGDGAARNTGFEKSRGEFLAFLDADDWWDSSKLRLQVDFLDEHSEIGYVVSHATIVLAPGVVSPPGLRPELLEKPVPAILPSALLVRRNVMNAVGIFDPAYAFGNDSDWFFRAQDMGIARKILPEVLLYRYMHDSNVSYKISLIQRDMLRLIRASLQRKRNSET